MEGLAVPAGFHRRGFGISAFDDAAQALRSSGAHGLIVDHGGRADVDLGAGAGSEAAVAHADREVVVAGAVDRHIVVAVVGDIAGEASALRLGSGRGGSGRILDQDVRGAGARDLALVAEDAVGAPAVHVGADVLDGQRRGVVAAYRRAGEIGGELFRGVADAVRRDEDPLKRFEGVRAGDEERRAADLSVFIGRVFGDLKILGTGIRSRRRLRGGARSRRRRGARSRSSLGVSEGSRGRDREDLGRLSLAHEDLIALYQTGEVLHLAAGEPLETGVASLGALEGGAAGFKIKLRDDVVALRIRVGDAAGAVLDERMLHGKGLVADHAVLEVEGALARVDVGVGNDDVIVEHVRPGVGRGVMEGVGAVRHDVGEGLFRVLFNAALDQGLAILADFPDPQVGGAVLRMLRGRDEFKAAVMVEIGDGVIPGLLALRLQQRGDLRKDQRELRVDIGQRGLLGLVGFRGLLGALRGLGGLRGLGALRVGGRSGGAAGGEAQHHDQREKHCDESLILHFSSFFPV